MNKIIQNCIEEAEQACRYVAKHNEHNMEESLYKDGFLLACELCEEAIGRHLLRHLDRILDETP